MEDNRVTQTPPQEGTAQETPQETTQTTPQTTQAPQAPQTTQEPAKEAIQETTQETTQDITQNTAQNTTHDTTQPVNQATKPKKPRRKTMTLKQRRLLKALPSSKSVMEAAVKAGYSPTSRQMYDKGVSAHIATLLADSPEQIKREYGEALEKCKGAGDMNCLVRILDSMSRIQGLFKDKSEVTHKNDVEPTIPQEEIDKDLELIISRRRKPTGTPS